MHLRFLRKIMFFKLFLVNLKKFQMCLKWHEYALWYLWTGFKHNSFCFAWLQLFERKSGRGGPIQVIRMADMCAFCLENQYICIIWPFWWPEWVHLVRFCFLNTFIIYNDVSALYPSIMGRHKPRSHVFRPILVHIWCGKLQ